MSMRDTVVDTPIRFADVSLVVGSVNIVEQISLTLGAEATTVVIGPNGAGKSTLLRLAMGLLQPTGGQITWGGRADVPPLRRAFVFQRPTMLRRSAAGNLRYALAAAGTPRAKRAARIAELLDLVGLGALAGRPARRLSGGEQQRLALARALAKDPDVLFLDEPTASLDPAATKAIEDLIRAIALRGIKVVMATHDLGKARRLGGDVVLMHRGRIVEHAGADAFFTAPKTVEAARFVAGELLI
jgi:tungstate transport system ATP-binding protein